MTCERRFANGRSLLARYTWGKSLDNVLNHEDNAGGSFPQNPNDTRAEKAASGFFFTPLVSPNPANTTTPARPNRVCDGNLPTGQRTIDHWFDVACFPPATGFAFGNSARQVIAGPGTINLDALLDRTVSFTESKSLEFRAEFFNATNSVNFNGPDMTVTQPQAGTITSAQPARIIQLALRFMF